jgi:hypothetical protein
MEIVQIALLDIKPYAKNPRKGNVDLIAESLATYGQYKPITVNSRTNEILAGNHTYAAAGKLGWTTIAVTYVDVDEETAAKIVAIDNKTSDLGEYDSGALLDLLTTVGDLSATGYKENDLDDLLALLQEKETPAVSSDTRFSTLEQGETGQSGVKHIASLGEYAERYSQKTTRMLMADYPNDTYVWLMEKLAEYRVIHKLTNNADAIVKLLETVFNEKAPDETV